MVFNIFAGKRVVITGDSGFKGSWLAAWLTRLGAEVTGFSLPPEQSEAHFTYLDLAQRIRHIDGDIRDADDILAGIRSAEPEFVFHLAAQALVRRSYVEPRVTFDTNVAGSVNVLEAIRQTPSVKVLVYVTSDKCYRQAFTPGGYRETDVLGGSDPYSASKACAELVLTSYQASFFAERKGFAAGSVRAGNVIGGGDWAEDRIVPDCIRALRAAETIRVRNPQAIRPWQHVFEALSGYLRLAALLHTEGRKYEGAWNFGPDAESHRCVSELVHAVAEEWGGEARIWESDSSKEAFAEAKTLHLNSEKARQALHWQPVWRFPRMIHETVDWYKRYTSGAGAWELACSSLDRFQASMDESKSHVA